MSITSGHRTSNGPENATFLNLLQTAQFADLTITCRYHSWKVHKVIAAGRSEFFRAAICGGWSEAQNSTVNLPEDDPEIIARLLLHMYTYEYPDKNRNDLKLQSSTFISFSNNNASDSDTTSGFRDLHLAVDLFAAGIKFGVKKIQSQACKAARFAVSQIIGDSGSGGLDSSELPGLVRKAYATSTAWTSEMRDILLTGILLHDIRPSSREFLQLLRDVPDFAYDMAVCIVSDIQWTCDACDELDQILIKPCRCCKFRVICKEYSCEETYTQTSMCFECGKAGTMRLF